MDAKYAAGMEAFLVEAKLAYERMFQPQEQAELKTFSQREVRVFDEGRRLSRFLLEAHLTCESNTVTELPRTAPCPHCQQPARRVGGKNLEIRPVTTLVGDVNFARAKYKCKACRKVFFSPLDRTLELHPNRRSPEVLKRVVEQGGNAASFDEASKQLRRNVHVNIGAKETQRLTERLGREWTQARDEQVEQFKQDTLPRLHGQAPQVAAVMVDGGRAQTRASEEAPGVHQPAWREVKYASLATLASRASSIDPQPEPPSKFLDPERVKKIVEQVHDQHVPAKARDAAKASKTPRKTRKRLKRRITRLVTTFVATMQNAEQFGAMVAAEAFQRGLDLSGRKAFVCDGQAYNWTIYEAHFRGWGFVPILDFLHLLGYLYAAAHAVEEGHVVRAWQRYAEWLRWAWSGQRQKLLSGLQAASARAGLPPGKAPEQDRRVIIARAMTYVANNYDRLDYPRYRKLGLPCSSAPMESAVKQFSRRVKGSEKFWVEEGSEAVLQVRAACLSQDDRAERLWSRPPPSHAYGSNWRNIAA